MGRTALKSKKCEILPTDRSEPETEWIGCYPVLQDLLAGPTCSWFWFEGACISFYKAELKPDLWPYCAGGKSKGDAVTRFTDITVLSDKKGVVDLTSVVFVLIRNEGTRSGDRGALHYAHVYRRILWLRSGQHHSRSVSVSVSVSVSEKNVSELRQLMRFCLFVCLKELPKSGASTSGRSWVMRTAKAHVTSPATTFPSVTLFYSGLNVSNTCPFFLLTRPPNRGHPSERGPTQRLG